MEILDEIAFSLSIGLFVCEAVLFIWMHKAVWDIEQNDGKVVLARLMMRVMAALIVAQVLSMGILFLLVSQPGPDMRPLRLALWVLIQLCIMLAIGSVSISVWHHRKRT